MQIAKSAKLTIVIEKNAEPLVDERVSISANQLTLEELVQELARKAKLSASIKKEQLVISVRESQ